MGYTTDFTGSVSVEPPLSQDEVEFLNKFSNTRRMKRTKGSYFVDGTGMSGQGRDSDIIDYNEPPEDQPGLWCQWVPTDDGTCIEWDGGEKFYRSVEWMTYIIEHFIGSEPKAKSELPFLQGHVVNGEIEAQGEESEDRWKLIVKNNQVRVVNGKWAWDE